MKKLELSAPLSQNLSILFLLLWAFAQALLIAFCDTANRAIYIFYLLLMDAAVMTGFLSNISICMALTGTLTCAWVAFKLYDYYYVGVLLILLDFLLIPMPLLGAGVAALFNTGTKSLNKENLMLRKQVENLVLVDELTGMYNERALYRDMQVMVHYTQRNEMPITLMIVQLRYASELRGILSRRMFENLLQITADELQTSVRREDRIYAIDNNGSFAILLTAPDNTAYIVKNRILAAIYKEGLYDGILDRGVQLDLRFAHKGYDRALYDNDMIKFKRAVESELVYDV